MKIVSIIALTIAMLFWTLKIVVYLLEHAFGICTKIEYFDNEGQYRQRLYGSKGISHNIDLIYQGEANKVPEKYKYCVKKGKEYCIIYNFNK